MTDPELLSMLAAAFAPCERPAHFTDFTHCCECAEHDELLRSRDRDEEVNHLGSRPCMSLRLREVTDDDSPLIEQWLHADHVRSTWGDPDANVRLLGEPPPKGNWRAIIEADGIGVGIVLWQHPTREELDVAGLADIPTSVIDIDIMIGEIGALGRGLGSGAIGLVAGIALSDPTVPFVMACARLDNLASQRAFAKAGFHKDRVFDDVPNGRHVLMVRHRHEPGGVQDDSLDSGQGDTRIQAPLRRVATSPNCSCRQARVRSPGESRLFAISADT